MEREEKGEEGTGRKEGKRLMEGEEEEREERGEWKESRERGKTEKKERERDGKSKLE